MTETKPQLPRTAKLFPGDRRDFIRYHLPAALSVEARWNGQVLELQRAPAMENISAGGVSFCLAAGTSAELPEGAELEIRFPLVEQAFHPARVYARCRGRVIRRDGADRVAVQFDQVDFVREDKQTSLPFPNTQGLRF